MAKCETCRFWDNSVASLSDSDTGRCIVRAPTLPSYSTGMGAWPFTSPEDGCGEHQPTKPDSAASLALMAEAMEPFIVAANAMGAETAETLVSLDLRDGEGEPITLHSDDFLRLADAYARATGA